MTTFSHNNKFYFLIRIVGRQYEASSPLESEFVKQSHYRKCVPVFAVRPTPEKRNEQCAQSTSLKTFKNTDIID